MSASMSQPWTIRASTCRFFPLFGKLHFHALADAGKHRLEMTFERSPPLVLCEVEIPQVGIPNVQIGFAGEILPLDEERRFDLWVTVCPSHGEDSPRLLCGRLDAKAGEVGGNDGTGVWVAEEDRRPGDG